MLWECYRLTALLLGIGVGIPLAEHLLSWRQLRDGGALSYAVITAGRWDRPRQASRWLRRALLDTPGFLLVLAVQAVAIGAMVVLAAVGELDPAVQALLLATMLLVNYRNWSVIEGSAQVLTVVAAGLLAFSLRPTSPLVADAGLWFIALHTCLAYCASGIFKVRERCWRSGEAIRKLVNTRDYGRPEVAALLHRRPGLAMGLSWCVMVAQILFPSALLLGQFGLIFLVWGLLFHAVNVYIMGLYRFFWAFLATYPAVWYCIRRVDGL